MFIYLSTYLFTYLISYLVGLYFLDIYVLKYY